MEIKIIKEKILLEEFNRLAQENYGDMVKGVVDVTQKILALGGELHADAETLLLENGSKQEDLWGFNIFKERSKEERIEFVSFINIRPAQKNFSMEIENDELQKLIQSIINTLVD